MAITLDRRAFLKLAAGGAIGAAAYSMRGRARGLYVDLTQPHFGPPLETPLGREVLYNGIELPSPWPPFRRQIDREASFPPYLTRPPEVIPIDVGRQLFVDDFLIEECELDRAYHSAAYIQGNPVLRPETPWERLEEPDRSPARLAHCHAVQRRRVVRSRQPAAEDVVFGRLQRPHVPRDL